MLPSEKTIVWQEISKYLDVEKTAQDLKKNFRLIEARDELEEAKIIRLILEEALKENKKSAIITNNDKLAKLLKLELSKEFLPFNDTRNLSIFGSHLVNFLLLILELFESDFNSHNLLAILKNPLCTYSCDKETLANFEINILRQDRQKSGLDGIKKKLAENEDLKKFFDDFCLKISDFSKPNLASQVASLISVAENLSQKSWTELLEIEPAQIELFEFFEKLKNYQKIALKPKNLLSTFKTLLSQVSYFEKSDSNAPIQILSTIEARLLNYDLVVIASLNDGDFPENEAENWLGKKIKKDLEIDRTLKKVGQSSYDFCNYLSNSSVVLTRCKSNSGKALIESPFLLKFKTICKKIDVDLDCSEKYSAILKNLNMVLSKKIGQLNPKPAAKIRPKKISITDISKLLANPYEIYAKKILQLQKLQEIDFAPSYAEFGSFVHKALEEFVKNPDEPDFLKKSEKIFAEYFLFNEAKLIWWPKFENIFAEFLIENEPFLNCQNQVEIAAEIEISGITIRGKIDRAILNEEGFLEIFDYKTGQIPSKKDVLLGKNPQLTIAALMLIEQKIASLNYWKLSSSSGSEIKKICSDSEEILILKAAAKAGLSKLFEFFSNEKNGYLATNNQQKSDYQNLMRQEEINK
jgi:ATP-dependent helicase/nuclease subunit B